MSLPRPYPHRVTYLQALATARLARYGMLKDSDDLEQSILCLTEAIFLPRSWDRNRRNIIETFSTLTLVLVRRADESRRPEDVTRSIIYLRYLRGQSLETFNIPPNHITELLVDALRIQVEMKI